MNFKPNTLTNDYQRISNVLITSVEISQAFNPTKISKRPETKQYLAIWDTGATNSAITKKVIDECQLKPIGIARVCTADGEKDRYRFLVSIFLPNRVCFCEQSVTEAKISGNVDVLIGMDVINKGDFAVTNKNGRTVMSFRFPSTEIIDFTGKMPINPQNKPIKTVPKVGRNEPCPCGSGKKYKKCCGR